MWSKLFWLSVLFAGTWRAEIIDRIAVTVGKAVITESEIMREIRLTAFLNGEPLDFSGSAKRKAAERLVEQTLIRREMALSGYPAPGMAEAAQMLDQIKRDRFPEEATYRRELDKYGLSEEDLKQHLLRQLGTLRFIDLRFRPAVQVLEPDLREYYEKQLLPEWHNKGRKPDPQFDEVREKIREILVAERVNLALDNWMKETRARTRIDFREKAFK